MSHIAFHVDHVINKVLDALAKGAFDIHKYDVHNSNMHCN